MRKRKERKTAFKKKVFIASIVFSVFLLAMFFILTLHIQKKEKIPSRQLNETLNVTTITTPFQENISIEVPPGVVRIEKAGRIHLKLGK